MFGWLGKTDKDKSEQVDTEPAEPAYEDTLTARAFRKNIYADATVTSHNGSCTNRAIILDISETGARLRFTNSIEIDDLMTIRIARYNIECRALPIWRTRTDVGVKFV